MNGVDLAHYTPTDTLYLWWLGQPQAPVLVGRLATVRTLQGVSLSYDRNWLLNGFALSEDLPLRSGEFLPNERTTAAGAVDDARPDRWGERVITVLDKPPRRSLMEFLLYAGDERFGALGVSVSEAVYTPRRLGPLPRLKDVDEMAELVRKIENDEPVAQTLRRLVDPGVTLGGARPKALLEIKGEQWVLKFGERGDLVDMPLVEHATLTLAAKAGIVPAPTRAIALKGKGRHAIAIKRFDRAGGARLHALSARVALQAAGEELSYPALAQLLRRRGTADGGRYRQQMAELFRRMVFNLLMDNTDDHEKNHVLLMNDAMEYSLSPAFDVLPSMQGLQYQAMGVGAQSSDSTVDNALSRVKEFMLSKDEAAQQLRQVAKVVAGWQKHFRGCGVSQADVDKLADYIDGRHLLEQRRLMLEGWPAGS
jgi:serine/threonine-protein kinase HipA